LILLFGSSIAFADHDSIKVLLMSNNSSGKTPLKVKFNISVSPASDPECAKESFKLEYGDGNFVLGSNAGLFLFTWEYLQPGTYTAVLTYTMESNHGGSRRIDCQSATMSAESRIVVEPLHPFVLEMIANPPIAAPGEIVTFDRSGSTDITCGLIFGPLAWDFGDGSAGDSNPIEHSYQVPGTYSVVVTQTDGCGRSATAQLLYQVQGNKAPAPGNGDDDGAAPVQTTTYTITESDGANYVVEPSSECLVETNLAPSAFEECFSIQIDMFDAMGVDAGKVILQRTANDVFSMAVSSPGDPDTLTIQLCSLHSNLPDCQPEEFCTETTTSCPTVGVGFRATHGAFNLTSVIPSTGDNAIEYTGDTTPLRDYLSSASRETLDVLDRFSMLNRWMSENPSEYAQLIDFLAEHNRLAPSGDGSSFPSGWDWDVIRIASCGNAGNSVACASTTGFTWIFNTGMLT
jgi:hypothetical protein